MNCQVILHIGAPKCGSTYLQRVLLKNQKCLREMGINYPHVGNGHPGNGANLHHITRPWLEQQTRGYDTLILSHEDLFSLPKHGLRLRNITDNVKVFVFLRPFKDWLIADYSQSLKQGCTAQSFKMFVKQRETKIIPSQFIRDWRDLFHMYPIHVAQHTNIQNVFTSQIPMTAHINWSIPKWRTNPSMPLSQSQRVAAALSQGNIHGARALIDAPFPEDADHTPPLDSLHFQAEAKTIFHTFGVQI